MDLFYKTALFIHVLFGASALISGAIAIIAQKGKNYHNKSGLIFFYSMMLVCISAISISIFKYNTFLLHIGIFSFFMVFSGYRSIKNKSLKPIWIDWAVLAIAVLNSIFMIASMQIVLVVFGFIGASLSFSDIKIFTDILKEKPILKNQWVLRHISMMMGGYISTFTAFVVVNITLENYAWIPWLLPTIIGTPIISYYTRKYSLKTSKK